MKRKYLVCIVVAIILVGAALSSQARDERGETLFAAARQGDLDAIKTLFAKGVNVNALNTTGATALHVAAGAGQREACEFLVKSGADVAAKDSWGKTPLHYAVASRHADATAFLIIKGKWAGTYEEEELEKVKRLLSQGMDVDAKGLGDKTLLHYAARTGYLHVAALLVGYGADMNTRNARNQTPLQFARQRRNASVILLLEDAKPGAFLTDQEDLNQWLHTRDVDPHGSEDRSHDVSVVSVKAPSHCVQGDVVPV
jgi:ankyrin repeat protein